MSANRTTLWALIVLASVPCGGQAAEADLPGEGSLFRSLFGTDLQQNYGISVTGLVDATWSRNNRSTEAMRKGGLSNSPVVGVGDEGFEMDSVFLFIDKSITSTMRPRITPLPGPDPTEASFGFTTSGNYGRNAQFSRTWGWDMHLNANEPGATDPAKATRDKQQFLSFANAAALGYLPIGTGITFMAGVFGPAIGYEIPPNLRVARNAFATKSYAFSTNPGTVSGVLLGTRAMNNPYGLLGLEVGVVQGYNNVRDNNHSKSVMGALRYRTPDMKTWVDYEFIVGNEQNDSSADVQFPSARVISPDPQFRQQHSLNGWHEFDPHWSIGAELTYGEQAGDGKPTTVDLFTGPGFNGAHWWGANSVLTYQQRKDLSYSVRAEYFADPQGYVLPSLAKGEMNAITAGLRYDLNRNVTLRPELRYDWFTDSAGAKPFGGGHDSSQLMGTVQLLVYF